MSRPGESFDGDDFLLPDLGEGLEEAEVIEWLIKEGQTVEDGDALALIETGKAQTEVYAPRSGKVHRLYGKAGDTIKVGSKFIGYGEESRVASKNKSPVTTPIEKPDAAEGVLEGDVFADEGDEEGTDPDAPREDAGTVVGQFQALAGVGTEGGKPLAAPAVRRMARDAGVDLEAIKGTGIGGRITEADVRAAGRGSSAKAPVRGGNGNLPRNGQRTPTKPPAPREESRSSMPAPKPRVAGEDVTRIPFRGLRRTIANRLRESVDKAVHFTVMDEADVTRLEATRKKLVAATGQKVSLLPFVCVALARVLSGEFGYEMARLNSTTDDEGGEILQHSRVHLGLAVDTSSGLMVPVIRDATTLGVMELGHKITELAAGCRDRSIPQTELTGSTFTVSNFGSYAGRFATPVINYPEAGIIAVGRMREGVVVSNGMMGVGKVLPLSLTCDHRVIDGGTATMTLNAIIKLLQNPDELLPEEV